MSRKPSADPALPPEDDHTPRALDRRIISLALPALGALIAEPLFVLADTAIVGHLGTAELAGLSLAGTILLTVVGLCIFLAYATTAHVGRLIGAGRAREAMQSGVDGLWLATVIGLGITGFLIAGAPWLVGLFDLGADAADAAVTYLRWSAPGLVGMLVVLAATGVLRGMQDTKTPLYVAATGASANAVLNVALVHGFGWGIAGSGFGSTICQLAMGGFLGWRVVRYARQHEVSLRPQRVGISGTLTAGIPLFVRSLSLRIAILLTVVAATRLGDVPLAGHQIVNSMWGLTAFILDALAIAAQAMVATALGAGDLQTVRAVLRRCLKWGVLAGAVLGAILALSAPLLTPLFTSDDAVRQAAGYALVAIGILMPMAGWVFVLDGVLIGAGDGRYLAAVGMLTVVIYLPPLAVIWWLQPTGAWALTWLWLAFGGIFMLARAVTTGWRIRTDAWMRL